MRGFFIATGLILVLTGCNLTEDHVTAKVTKLSRDCFKANDCRYMAYTDKENLQITDTWNRHNSSDLYAQLKEGKTYNFTVNGWRNPSSSSFRNILEAREVS